LFSRVFLFDGVFVFDRFFGEIIIVPGPSLSELCAEMILRRLYFFTSSLALSAISLNVFGVTASRSMTAVYSAGLAEISQLHNSFFRSASADFSLSAPQASGLGVSPTSVCGISLAVRRIPLCLLFLLRLGAFFMPAALGCPQAFDAPSANLER
jgi:hypothetical protein